MERFMQFESAGTGRIHGPSDQLQLVRSGTRNGTGAGEAEHALTIGDRTQASQTACALCSRLSLHQDGPLDFRVS